MKVQVENLSKIFGRKADAVRALDAVSITVEPGEMLALLGPSGCGKSTLLRCISGLELPSDGRIVLGNQTVYDTRDPRSEVPTEDRHLGMVFQSYALWPHRTVLDNVAYPLRCRGVRRGAAREKARETLTLVDCSELSERYPAQLSGGQQQRVALARALVSDSPVVLFDEPLSNLDARLREHLRVEIRALHQRIGFTGIYVTHDQEEAWVVADRIAVMHEGRVVQHGTATDLRDRPATEFVARFVTDMNTISGTLASRTDSGHGVLMDFNGRRLEGRLLTEYEIGSYEPAMCIRPTDLHIRSDSSQLEGNVWHGEVLGVAELRDSSEVLVRLRDGQVFKVSVNGSAPPESGKSISLFAHSDDCLIVPKTAVN